MGGVVPDGMVEVRSWLRICFGVKSELEKGVARMGSDEGESSECVGEPIPRKRKESDAPD